MLTIYGIPTLNTVKVVLTAEQLELDYDFVQLDFSKQEHKSAEHLLRHPLGKAPAIDHDGQFLCESNTVCVYLADINKSSLYTGDSYQRARIHQWIDMMSFHMGRWLTVHYFEKYIKPNLLNDTPDEALLKEADDFLTVQMPILDQRFKDHEFICGADMTVADLVAFSFVNSHEVSGFSIEPFAGITRWYQQLRTLPAYTRTADVLGLNR